MFKFGYINPIVLFFYIAMNIFIAMFTLNPILLAMTLTVSVSLYCYLSGYKKFIKSLVFSLPMLLIITITNPLFSHKGETILFYLFRLPVTKESILYGLAISFMLIASGYWFACYNEIMTQDKLIYIFGNFLPKFSIMITMTARTVPRMIKKYKDISDTQKALGVYSGESYFDRLKGRFRVLNTIITWGLENGVDTADSMRARGYGLPHRSSYKKFKWHYSDIYLLTILSILAVTIIVLLSLGFGEFDFFPVITDLDVSFNAVALYILSLVFMSSVMSAELKEVILWRYLKSKI